MFDSSMFLGHRKGCVPKNPLLSSPVTGSLALLSFHSGPGSLAEGVRRVPRMRGSICLNGANCLRECPSSRDRENVSLVYYHHNV